MQKMLNKLVPFVLVGFAIVAFAFGIMLIVYLLIFGAIVGLILFAFNWIKDTFFIPKAKPPAKKTGGRIIDSDDWKQL